MADAPPPTGSGPRWPLLGVAAGLIALPVIAAVLTVVLLTAPTASGGRGGHRVSSPMTEVSAACAASNRDPVHSTRAGAASALVPPGATAVLLCRYGPGGARVRERSIADSATASQLGWELNLLRPASGTYACPSDDGASITADFSYPSGAENPVSVGLSGCQIASNGSANRLGLGHAVVRQLEELVRP